MYFSRKPYTVVPYFRKFMFSFAFYALPLTQSISEGFVVTLFHFYVSFMPDLNKKHHVSKKTFDQKKKKEFWVLSCLSHLCTTSFSFEYISPTSMAYGVTTSIVLEEFLGEKMLVQTKMVLTDSK